MGTRNVRRINERVKLWTPLTISASDSLRGQKSNAETPERLIERQTTQTIRTGIRTIRTESAQTSALPAGIQTLQYRIRSINPRSILSDPYLTMGLAILQPFQQEQWAMGIRKGNNDLRQKINGFLKHFKETGGFEQLGVKYFSENKKAFEELGLPFNF
jgi:hypothetical protein